MKLSKETIEILKNAASISNEVVINAGNMIKISSVGSRLLMYAEIEESFDTTFGISNLSNFISIISELKDFELEFPSLDRIIITSDNTTITYATCDPETIVQIKDKEVYLTKPVYLEGVKVFISEENLKAIGKFSSLLGKLPDLKIESDGSVVKIKIYDRKDERNISVSKGLCEIIIQDENPEGVPYSFMFNDSIKLNLLAGSYVGKINDKLIHLTHESKEVDYFIASAAI